jgi:hypothetical protein
VTTLAVTASRAVATNSSGLPVAAATTATELGYVNGVTSAIQTQLDAKLANTATANRFIISNGSGSVTTSAVTASRIVATDSNGLPTANASLTSNRMVYSDGNGSIASAGALTQNRVVTADVNGIVSSAAAITASRALISDANGVPTHSTLTSANLANAACTVTDSNRIDLTLSGNDLTADLKNGSVVAQYVASQSVAYAAGSNTGGASQSISSTSYANFASFAYTPRASTSTVMVEAFGIHVYTSGTTTFAIRRGTTVIGGGTTEPTATITTAIALRADDTGHGGSTQTYNFSVKNSTPAGSMNYCWIQVTDTI